MSPNLFLTGTTGYIGGSVLETIVSNHPEYNVTVLLRKTPDVFAEKYPNIKVVKGDYDSFGTIAEAASQADVVIHSGDSDHEPSINALISGLLRRATPSFLIHLSGTGILSDFRSPEYLGKLNPKVWSDVADIGTIRDNLPHNALHRNVDKIIHAASAEHGDKLKTAIVCPPDIYGKGKGLLRKRSVFVPVFVNEAKKLGGRVFYVGEGTNTRGWVHLDDLMTVYLKLVEAAVAGGVGADWGKDGYYFATSQEWSQLDVARATGKILRKHGVIENEEPISASLEQIDSMLQSYHIDGLAKYLFASNSRTKADRATKLFGYEPKAANLLETLEEDILAAVKENGYSR